MSERAPVHVTAFVARDVGPLRSGRARSAFRGAIDHARALASARVDFTIVRLRSEPSRVELLIRAHDAIALARGMQGFQIAAARALNSALGRRGSVFPDRYTIRTPRPGR